MSDDHLQLSRSDLRAYLAANKIAHRDAEIIRLRFGLSGERPLSTGDIARLTGKTTKSVYLRYLGAMTRLAEAVFSVGQAESNSNWADVVAELSVRAVNAIRKHNLTLDDIHSLGLDGLCELEGVGLRTANELVLALSDDGIRQRILFPGLEPNP